MTKLLINNIEQNQPRGESGTHIVLFGRPASAPERRVRITATGFEPYFYAPAAEAEARRGELLSMDCIRGIEDESYQALDGTELRKVLVPKPQDVRTASDLFDETWESDVPFTNRFRVDSGVCAYVEVPDEAIRDDSARVEWSEITPLEAGSGAVRGGGNVAETGLHDVEPRVVTLDIEVDDRGDEFPSEGNERILSVVAHDSYSDETIGFLDGNGRNPMKMFPSGAPEEVDVLDVRNNESKMLSAFAKWFADTDPDLITGWNVDGFDAPFLIQRMEKVNEVSKDDLSPMGWAGVTRRGEARIKGRTIYDLLTVYKRNSRTELSSYSLDDVAQEELDSEKLQFDGSYYDLYQEQPEKFINYNARDVRLVVEINDEAEVIPFRDRLRRQVGVDFEDSYDPKDFDDMMCRRKLFEKGLAGPRRPDYGDEPDGDYEGAFVFDAYEGVTENVVGIDLASLYPYTMAMLNASPETKVDADADVPKCEASNGQHFRLDEDGIFREIIFEALDLKAEYKEQLQRDDLSKAEQEKAARDYMAAKVVVNSLYGVTGWERFFLYDVDVAEAVTLTGQLVIKETADFIEHEGYEVIYGDSVPDFEPVTIRNSHGDVNVVPIEEAWKKFEQGRRFQVWCDTEWANVENAIRKPNRKDMYRVRTGDGVVHVTEDHGLLRPDGTEVTPAEISVGDELMHTPHNHSSFESTTSGVDENTAWLWGLFAGDGTCGEYDCNSGVKNQWKISGDAREPLERAAHILASGGYTPRLEYIDSDDYTGRLVVSEVAELVNKYRHKFYTENGKKRVPRAILNATDEAKRAFLGGYQAADGDKDSRYDKPFYRSHTNSETLAQGIAVLLQSLGKQCGVNVRDNYGKEYTRIWSRQRGGGVVVEEVKQVEYSGDYVYDLSTESEHFNAGVGTITVHNTDSCYMKMPDDWSRERCLETARNLVDELNTEVYPELATTLSLPASDNLWEIEVEAYMKRYFQAGRKKRYAYLATWKDGHEVDNPEPSISGFSSKRSDSSKLTTETEARVFDAILSGNADAIDDIVFEAASVITAKNPDWGRVGIPGGMGKKITDDPQKGKRDEYYAVSCNGDVCYPQDAQPRGAYNSNAVLGTDFGKGDKPKRVYIEDHYFEPLERSDNVLCYDDGTDIEPLADEIRVDVPRMTDTLLVNPLERILDAIDKDIDAVIQGQTQTGLGAFS